MYFRDPRVARRFILRRAAHSYARHQWPVLPGAMLVGGRFSCGPLCATVACHPAVAHWERQASAQTSDVDSWWVNAPFSVLLATGRAFDVIEVPAAVGRLATPSARRWPVAVTPTGRWMFLVQPGEALRPELGARVDVALHGTGAWVPAPPTRTPEGRVRWLCRPEAASWRLPGPYDVQQALVANLRAIIRPATFASTTPRLGRAA